MSNSVVYYLFSASVLLLLLVASTTASSKRSNTIPNMTWVNQPLRLMPVVLNFIGSATLIGPQRATPSGFIGIGPITMAPLNGNFQNSTIEFNGQAVKPTEAGWTPCEGTRRSKWIQNSVRLTIDKRVLLQKWTTNNTIMTLPYNVTMFLDGPYFRQCDAFNNSKSGVCGWGTPMPIDRQHFHQYIVPPKAPGQPYVMVASDTYTSAFSASIVLLTGRQCSEAPVQPRLNGNTTWGKGYYGFGFNVSDVSLSPGCTMWHISSAAESLTAAMNTLMKIAADGPNSWFENACGDWKQRWDAAFEPAAGVYSGNLPFLDTTDAALEKLYGWAAAAMVSLTRFGYPSYPRQFVISEGPSPSFDGSKDAGGSGQFSWDLSFNAVAESLLEPNGTRHLLQYIVGNANFSNDPILVPQAWDGFPKNEKVGALGDYCFDFVAVFIFIQSYVTMTGDVAFLKEVVPNVHNSSVKGFTPLDFLRKVAWAWKAFPRSVESPYLVDYGSNKRSFLEAVSSYIDVIAGLQGSNAGMMLSLARLLEGLGDHLHHKEILALRGNATQVVKDMVQFQFVPSNGGWMCLKANASVKPQEVRCLADTIYIGLSAGLLAGQDAMLSKGFFPLPDDVRQGMIDLFFREFSADSGWVRATSLEDPSMRNIMCRRPNCGIEALVGMRSDWTASGGYGGLAGGAVDAVAELEQGFDGALQLLHTISVVADAKRGTMPAQGVAVMTPPFMQEYLNNNDGIEPPQHAYAPGFPEFFDEPGWFWTWPNTERAIQNAEAAIVDAFVRSIFGWRPDWGTTSSQAATTNISQAISKSLWLPTTPRRGFNGTLRNLKTPFQGIWIDIHASEAGVTWQFSK